MGIDGVDGVDGVCAAVVASEADDDAAGCDTRALLKSMAWPIFRGVPAIGKDH